MAALMFFYGAAMGSAQPEPVPAAYQNLYDQMQTSMNSFSQTIQSNWNGVKYPVIFAADLSAATSENGMGVLQADDQANVLTQLQELQALGVEAVDINLNFPTLYAPYYADQSQYQQMLAYYTNLAAEIRGRGLKLIVECHVEEPNPADPDSTKNSFVQSMSWTAYVAGRAQMAATVAQALKPDYLSVLAEPDTDAEMSGKSQVDTVSGSVQLISAMLAAIQAAGVSGVAVGAGAGTWQSSFVSFVDADAALPLQFIDVHVYPVNDNFLPNALTAADIAHQAGKEIGMSECWLEKIRDNELASTDANVYVRNNWSFWGPLDAQFEQLMTAMANYKTFAFVSPFWSNYFFAYLDYAPSGQTVEQGVAAGMAAMQQGQFTVAGAAFENSILPSADRTAPQVPSPPEFAVFLRYVQISWQPTADNVGVAGYRLYRNGQLIAITAGTSFDDAGGGLGVSYAYAVSAFDAAGNVSAQSAPAQSPKRYF
jgi:hypothetical protein